MNKAKRLIAALMSAALLACMIGQPYMAKGIVPAGSVILVNNAWTRVRVEVRKGKSDDVNQNSHYETKTIGKGKWQIPCSSDEGYVWWRRDADPDNPNGRWNDWSRKACFGKDEEVKL